MFGLNGPHLNRRPTGCMRCSYRRRHVRRTTKMTELVERITTIFLPRGRPTKFTPARIQQIRTLVERGKSREEIAELIGVTVGSLQVTCSRLSSQVICTSLKTSSGSSCSRHRSGVRILASSSARSLQQRSSGTFFGKRRTPNMAAFNREQDSINYLI